MVKHEQKPSMVLCVHFVQDWQGMDPHQARNQGSHLVANQLLVYRRAPIIGQELWLATGSAHWQRKTVDAFKKDPSRLKGLSFPPLGLGEAREVLYGMNGFWLGSALICKALAWMESCTASKGHRRMKWVSNSAKAVWSAVTHRPWWVGPLL